MEQLGRLVDVAFLDGGAEASGEHRRRSLTAGSSLERVEQSSDTRGEARLALRQGKTAFIELQRVGGSRGVCATAGRLHLGARVAIPAGLLLDGGLEGIT